VCVCVCAVGGDRTNCVRSDDEHHLIARYVETLSSANGPHVSSSLSYATAVMYKR